VLTTLANVGGSHLVGTKARRFEGMMAAWTNASSDFTSGLLLTRGSSPPDRQVGQSELRDRAVLQAASAAAYNADQRQLGADCEQVWHVTDNL